MSKKKNVWQYAIVRTMFGDFWVGKTKLPIDSGGIYDDVDEAVEEAKRLTEETFEMSDEIECKLIELENTDDIEEIPESCFPRIVK